MVQAEQKRQIQALAKRQMKLMKEITAQKDRDYQMMLWCGFLTGLRLTNAITHEEYNRYYTDLQELANKMDEAEPKKKTNGKNIKLVI